MLGTRRLWAKVIISLYCLTLSAIQIKNRTLPSVNFARGDYVKLRSEVVAKKIEQEIKDMNVCQAWYTMTSKVFEAMGQCIPKLGTSKTKKNTPWIRIDMAAKIKKTKQAYKRYMETRDGKDYQQNTKACDQAKNACRNAVRDHEKTVAAEAKKNPKKFFAYIKTKMKTKDSVADLNDSGQKVSTDDGKANLLNRFVSSVFTAEDLTCVLSCEDKDFISPLSEIDSVKADVAERLPLLNPNKSPGSDSFHPRVLKELAHELSEPLAMVFDKSL